MVLQTVLVMTLFSSLVPHSLRCSSRHACRAHVLDCTHSFECFACHLHRPYWTDMDPKLDTCHHRLCYACLVACAENEATTCVLLLFALFFLLSNAYRRVMHCSDHHDQQKHNRSCRPSPRHESVRILGASHTRDVDELLSRAPKDRNNRCAVPISTQTTYAVCARPNSQVYMRDRFNMIISFHDSGEMKRHEIT
jgi:hypothetical protein